MNDILKTSTTGGNGSLTDEWICPAWVRSETNGYSIAVDALAAGDAYSGIRSVVGVVNGSNSYGAAGYFEADCSGTQAGEFFYVGGFWANLNSGTYGAGKYVCAQDNGIYENASCTVTGAKLVYGMRMEAILGDSDALVFPFSTNNNNQAITALIDCENSTDLGITTGKSTAAKYLPLYRDAAGNIGYALIYT
jgi:hypothetical protein